MYYIGTYQQCINYDLKVTQSEKYSEGSNWANPIQSQTAPNKWAILKAYTKNGSPRTYNSEMQEVEELPNDFYNTLTIIKY